MFTRFECLVDVEYIYILYMYIYLLFYAGKSFTHKKRCAACFQPSHQRTLSRAAPSFLCLGFALSGGTGMRLLLAALGQPAESENVSIFHVETRIN